MAEVADDKTAKQMAEIQYEKELIILAQAGDDAAFEELFKSVRKLLYKFAHKYSAYGYHRMEDVDLMVCEYFVIAVKNFNVELNYRFTTYLVRVVWSNYTKEIKAAQRLKRKAIVISLDAPRGGESELTLYNDLATSSGSLCSYEADFTVAELTPVYEGFEAVYARLRPQHQAIIHDYLVNKMSFKDIREKYNMSKQSVSAVLARFRVRLYNELREQEYFI